AASRHQGVADFSRQAVAAPEQLAIDLIFDALLDIDYKRDIVFERFSTTVVDEGLSLACAIWRDNWEDNDPLAAHAKRYIELKYDEA
ncbi:hypothetical protein AB9F35_34625, partial [Rhizobium leguminosarum]